VREQREALELLAELLLGPHGREAFAVQLLLLREAGGTPVRGFGGVAVAALRRLERMGVVELGSPGGDDDAAAPLSGGAVCCCRTAARRARSAASAWACSSATRSSSMH
jgi:hypothetical protein